MVKKGLLLSLAVIMVFALAVFPAAAQEKKAEGSEAAKGGPSGDVTINVTKVAAGIGISWGDGTLNFKGKNYKFKVKGLNLIGLGVTSINAQGEVYNLKNLDDFPGTYYGVEAGATLIKGSAGLVLKNSKGTVLNLKSEKTGAGLSVGNEGLSISPAWD